MEQILGCCWNLSPNSKIRAIYANNAQLTKLMESKFLRLQHCHLEKCKRS